MLGMAQSPDLPGLGPHGNRQLKDRRCQGLEAWHRRRICQGLDPTGIGSVRIGNARGRGHGAVAGSAGARTQREPATRGLVTPGVVGMALTPDLLGLGLHGKLQFADWGRQGSWAWHRRRICEGLDPMGIRSSRLGDARGCGHGAVAGSARARNGEEPVRPGRGSERTRSGGTG